MFYKELPIRNDKLLLDFYAKLKRNSSDITIRVFCATLNKTLSSETDFHAEGANEIHTC